MTSQKCTQCGAIQLTFGPNEGFYPYAETYLFVTGMVRNRFTSSCPAGGSHTWGAN